MWLYFKQILLLLQDLNPFFIVLTYDIIVFYMVQQRAGNNPEEQEDYREGASYDDNSYTTL